MVASEPTLRSPATWQAVLAALSLFLFCTTLGISPAVTIPLSGVFAGWLAPRLHQARMHRDAGR